MSSSSTSNKYVLHYWNIAARGELIRIALHHAGVEFEDKRYEFSEKPAIKKNTDLFPLGEMPVFIINGVHSCQSHAIARYIAREHNLYGKNNQEMLIVDQIMDTLVTIENRLWPAYFFVGSVEEKKKQLKELFSDYVPRAFNMVEKILKANNDGQDFLVGKELSLADIHLLVTIESIELEGHNLEEYKSFIDGYPLIKSFNQRLRNSDKIKNYLDKRGPPFYPFPKIE